jgi:thiopurine S-methyltransferase
MSSEKDFWTKRYKDDLTGWDIGAVSSPLKAYFDQLTNKTQRILIPGAGNAHEAAYLFKQGFTNVSILDISPIPLNKFKNKNPDFAEEHLIEKDFFKHKGTYDLIIEQTFFCSFVPQRINRVKYATKMASLLAPKGKLVGVWFDFPLTEDFEKRPFGGSLKEYKNYLSPLFNILTFEKSYNSISQREGKELFGIFSKKESKPKQANNPLHGITLKTIIEELVAKHGWEYMDQKVRINCFSENPTINSSLKFLRKTPWAREKVEQLYIRSIK